MTSMTAPFTLSVEPTASAPALLLRPWQDTDIETIVKAYRDDAMRRWLMGSVDGEHEARAWLARWETGWADDTRLSWAIEEEHEVVGHFVVKAAEPPETLATGVGYWTLAQARGRGIASRCVEAVTQWLFSSQVIMPADEVELLHKVGNQASCRVAEKSGYPLDSILPAMPPRFLHEGHRHLRRCPV